ncbi:FAD/NAD(P)-binding domain-containing protein [Trametes coccinea BRFM310]|uniref:FAD/NAD(P)-binding domain-containing protein n=1 Tax=Trametes coccinea (strain BRFM310) TaxID=1353009 RepID=A0A1Y2I8I0_TRAC3|nr:FAD/NAD(P)-binding domain-containing protein [Trametes coccinea BRFM310]
MHAIDVELAFTFKFHKGYGRGYARLLPDADGAFKALSVMMMLYDIAGHEESKTLPLRDDLTGVPGRSMQKELAAWVDEVQTKPHVLIVGAGQTGLQIAARMKAMQIPALVIERSARIGDQWRKRYPTLTLHTIKRHHTLLYQPYPTNWPEYTPKDKLADWLEQYASIQDLLVWTASELQPRPTYDFTNGTWNVSVRRGGTDVQLRPAHIVLATGTLGDAYMPDCPGRDIFHGEVLHSESFHGGADYAGKRVLVIGAGNTSIDICQDLVLNGAHSVTMIQRSSTCVMSRDLLSSFQRQTWADDRPLDIADFLAASWPIGLQKKLAIASQDAMWHLDKELHDKLRKGGLKLNMGPEGEGLYVLTLERFGGGSQLLTVDSFFKGRTKEAQTKSPMVAYKSKTESRQTGYLPITESNRTLLGDDVIHLAGDVYGLDAEGELKGSYRPTGHPGLWYGTGDFFVSRFYSKLLSKTSLIASLYVHTFPSNPSSMRNDPYADAIASYWVTQIASALQRADSEGFSQLFLPNGWLRDLLVFSGDTRALVGRDKIHSYLRDTLQDAQISNVGLSDDPHLLPRMYLITVMHTIHGDIVEFAFTFECLRGHGRGRTVLYLDQSTRTYSIASMMMMLSDIKRLAGGDEGNTQGSSAAWIKEVEVRPYVLIVGAGQTGLQLAARMKAMGIPALVIEHDARIGDHWRRRYPSLTLQTLRRYNTLLYQPYPPTWPEYIPKDLMADWLEHYTVKQGLVVWTESELQPHPVYDTISGTWDITILRNGQQTVKMRPSHIVITTGTVEEPYMPDCPGRELYQGQVLHSHTFTGGSNFSGKRVVVIGAGGSAVDICQDLTCNGAESHLNFSLRCIWTDDRPVDVADFVNAAARQPKCPHTGGTSVTALPSPPRTQWRHWTVEEIHKELYDKLRKGGFQLNMGPGGKGLGFPVLQKIGGWDAGAADLIADGTIQVKSGISPQRFTKTGLVFSDETELAADAIIFATGYQSITESVRGLLGDDISTLVGDVSGVDAEGEMKASYRPTGHPGLWFATGDFFVSRFYSKILALQIKARQLQLDSLWNAPSATTVTVFPTTVAPMDTLLVPPSNTSS